MAARGRRVVLSPVLCVCAVQAAPTAADLDDRNVPRSVMMAVKQGTRLWLFLSGCHHPEDAVLVELDVGDVFVWRGDLVHAGAGASHPSLHCPVISPATITDEGHRPCIL